MALPTTNLTAHFDASTNAHVWKFYQSTTPYHNTAGSDGDNIEVWDDSGDGSVTDLSLGFVSSSAQGPTYQVSSPLMQASCLDFNGSTELLIAWNEAQNTNLAFNNFANAGAKTLIFSLYIEGITNNNANAFLNDGVFADTKQFFGVFLKTSGGTNTLMAYNWDGNADVVSQTVSLNTSYVVTVRHDGTNLYLGLNGGTESSVASGNTSDINGSWLIAVNGNGTTGPGTALGNIRIGEWAIYNAALTGTNLSDANSYFTSKWLTTGSNLQPIIPADSLNNWADGISESYRLPADAMTMGDTAPTVQKNVNLTRNLTADAMVMADTAPTIQKNVNKTANLTADALNLWADAIRLGKAYSLAADSMTQADSMGLGWAFNFTDSITWQDSVQATTGGALRLNVPADDLNSWADPDYELFGDHVLSLDGESLDNWGDARTVDKQDLGGNLISVPLPADSLNNWADTYSLGKPFNLPADPWGNLADQPATVVRMAPLSVNLAADPMPAYGERLGAGLSLADTWQTLADTMRFGWAFNFTDSITWQDSVQATAGGALRLNLTADAMTMGDQPVVVNYAKPYNLAADSMVMADLPVAYSLGKSLSLADNLAAYMDALGLESGLRLSFSDGLVYADDIAVQRIGNLIAGLLDANAPYADYFLALVPGYDQKVAFLVDNLANWQDAVGYLRDVYGIHLQGKSSSTVALNGRSKQQEILTGKSGEYQLSGRSFTGEI